jgi:hypothetical protein
MRIVGEERLRLTCPHIEQRPQERRLAIDLTLCVPMVEGMAPRSLFANDCARISLAGIRKERGAILQRYRGLYYSTFDIQLI